MSHLTAIFVQNLKNQLIMKNGYFIASAVTFLVAAIIMFTSHMRETSEKPVDPCEYQLVIVDDSIIISDHGRHVTTIHIDSSGTVATELIKDNL